MGKQQRRERAARDTGPQMAVDKQPTSTLQLATLAGVVALLVVSFSNWRAIGRIGESLDDRFDRVETRVSQVSEKVDKVSVKAPEPSRRGPDPDRVYTVNTAGAPIKGPASAPVTIVEFSDFQ